MFAFVSRSLVVCVLLAVGASSVAQEKEKKFVNQPETAEPLTALNADLAKIAAEQKKALTFSIPTLDRLTSAKVPSKPYSYTVSVLKGFPSKNTVDEIEKLEVDDGSALKAEAATALNKIYEDPTVFHDNWAVYDKTLIAYKGVAIRIRFDFPNQEISAEDQLKAKAEVAEALWKLLVKPRYETISTYYGNAEMYFGISPYEGETVLKGTNTAIHDLLSGKKVGAKWNLNNSITLTLKNDLLQDVTRTVAVRFYYRPEKDKPLKAFTAAEYREIYLMWRRHVNYVETGRDEDLAALKKPDPYERPDIRIVEPKGNDVLTTNRVTLGTFVAEKVKSYDQFDKVLREYSPELSAKIKKDWDRIQVRLLPTASTGDHPDKLPNNVFGTIQITSSGSGGSMLKIAEPGFLKFDENAQASAIVYYSLAINNEARIDSTKILSMVLAVHHAVANPAEREKLTKEVFESHLKQVVVSPATDSIEQLVADLRKTHDTFKARLIEVNLPSDTLLSHWDALINVLRVEHAKSLNKDLRNVLGVDRGLNPSAAAMDEKLKLKKELNDLIDSGKYTKADLDRFKNPPPPPQPQPPAQPPVANPPGKQ